MCNSRQCIFICTEVKETLLVKSLDVLATLFPALLFLCKSSTHSCATPLKLLCLRTWWGFQPSALTLPSGKLFYFHSKLTPLSKLRGSGTLCPLLLHRWPTSSIPCSTMAFGTSGVQSPDVIQRRLHVKWKQKGGGMGRVEGGKRSKPNTSVLRTINSKTVLGLAFVFSMTGIARLRTWLQTLPSCTSIGSQDQVFQMICPISLSWYL